MQLTNNVKNPEILKDIPNQLPIFLRSLAEELRLAILVILFKRGATSFTVLCEELNISTGTLSHHLTNLTRAGLVDNFYQKNEGKAFSFYEITRLGSSLYQCLLNALHPEEHFINTLNPEVHSVKWKCPECGAYQKPIIPNGPYTGVSFGKGHCEHCGKLVNFIRE